MHRLVRLAGKKVYTWRNSWTALSLATANARTDRVMSSSVVAQEQTLMRITAFPCQPAPPAQHSPEAWIFRRVSDVISSLSHAASTWLNTTSFKI